MGKKNWLAIMLLVLLLLPMCAFADLPKAEVTEIVPCPVVDGRQLNYALAFKALPYEGECKTWEVDYELQFNKDIPSGTVMIAGQYQAFGENWVPIDITDDIVKIKANQPIRVMKKGIELSPWAGTKFTYELLMALMDIFEFDPTFRCGVYVKPEFLEANPDFDVQLALCMYGPNGKRYLIGKEYHWPPRAAAQAPDMPQTGDDANIALFAMLAAVSMIGLLAMNRSVRSRKQN